MENHEKISTELLGVDECQIYPALLGPPNFSVDEAHIDFHLRMTSCAAAPLVSQI
jgi:hypothetical protein